MRRQLGDREMSDVVELPSTVDPSEKTDHTTRYPVPSTQHPVTTRYHPLFGQKTKSQKQSGKHTLIDQLISAFNG